MTGLTREKCVACTGETPGIDPEEAAILGAELDDAWQVGGDALTREFRFKTFNAAFGLATRIALLAEAEGHHPDLEVGWGRLVVRLTTHAISGLSRNDFIMAAKIDRLAGPPE
jgi:4a-hydroxytetrahydrobiopterin dehydratase